MTKPMCVCVFTVIIIPIIAIVSINTVLSVLQFFLTLLTSYYFTLLQAHIFLSSSSSSSRAKHTQQKRLTSPLRQTPSGEMKEEGRSCRTHYSGLPLFFAFWRATITQRVSVQTTDCVNNQPSPATKCECRLANAIGRRQFSNVEEKKGEEIA